MFMKIPLSIHRKWIERKKERQNKRASSQGEQSSVVIDTAIIIAIYTANPRFFSENTAYGRVLIAVSQNTTIGYKVKLNVFLQMRRS